ncbi:Hsp20/alpha crystallin family protein [Kyrpidia tusciae]|uniref:Heat shock protein Hsp20 n=1 Tax=Kyrpidia tusciae (strain DSM 2912 / NBRC 15312 / T2) TaxID=562970 RepID=D5WS11_KYRT2|nr:Hsp20/alpha crystallin family protein [Kyrpidia tusciae]ADG06963.1 heat shock protein Hsp20 [Kyrpidia tusciae DSM 2912]
MPLPLPVDPLRHLESFRRDVGRLLDPEVWRTGGVSGALPRVDVHETENQVVVSCDIPGLRKADDVEIDVDDDRVHLSGVIERDEERREQDFLQRERFYGRFSRTVALPVEVKPESARASYRNGVLEIRMDKARPSRGRRVNIEFH